MDDRLDEFAEERRKDLLDKDEIYQKDWADQQLLSQRYMQLDITEEQRRIIEDYIACILTTQYRVAALSYVAGGRDTYRMLKELDLLK